MASRWRHPLGQHLILMKTFTALTLWVKSMAVPAVNGVWVLPGTHKHGRVDIVKLMAEAGTERLPEAVPIICNAGDVVINNRQILHGSFANTGFETRVSVNFGFHRRSSVLNVHGAGIHAEAATFDDAFIKNPLTPHWPCDRGQKTTLP